MKTIKEINDSMVRLFPEHSELIQDFFKWFKYKKHTERWKISSTDCVISWFFNETCNCKSEDHIVNHYDVDRLFTPKRSGCYKQFSKNFSTFLIATTSYITTSDYWYNKKDVVEALNRSLSTDRWNCVHCDTEGENHVPNK